MADRRISELPVIPAVASDDALAIVDTSLSETNKVSVEDLLRSAPAGTAAAPSIAFVDDPDTGFYRSAANELSISTNGSQRVVVDDAGNVGIGTSSPVYKFDVAGGAENTYLRVKVASTDTNQCGLLFGEVGSAAPGQVVYSHVDDSMRLATDNSERMRITSAGLVGIGTSSPTQRLEVNGTILANNYRVPDTGGTISGSNSQNGAAIQIFDNVQQLRLWTNAVERMRIDSTGNIGIGTGSPGHSLEVSKASPADGILATFRNSTNAVSERAGIRFEQSDTSQLRCDLLATRMGSNAGVDFSIELANSSGGNQERFRITEDGNVGIGTSAPNRPLEIRSAVAALRLTDSDNNATTEIIQDFLTTQIINSGAGDIRFSNNGTERMRIDSAGNVGIGTTSPNQKLHIESTGSNAIVNVNRTDAATAGVIQLGAGNGANFITNTGTKPFFIATDNTERMRIDSAGNVGIGTSSPATALEISGTNAAGSRLRVTRSGSSGEVGMLNNDLLLASLGSDGSDGGVLLYSGGSERMRIRSNGVINYANCPTYADDSAAGTGGLVAGDVYKTSTGELRIKL